MPQDPKSENQHLTEAREAIVTAALPHVAFDGWSDATLRAAIDDSGVDVELARLALPRGAIDLALAFHRAGDRKLDQELTETDLNAMRIRDRVTYCVRRRIELIADHREAVRRGATLFALPIHTLDGGRVIWETADLIWRHCGDTATDYNWYSKRAILGSVYSSTVLFWLGNQDPKAAATWDFLDRRIDNVMQIERIKSDVRKNPLARAALWGPAQLLKMVRAPGSGPASPHARQDAPMPDKVE